jgi:hypothetical protein
MSREHRQKRADGRVGPGGTEADCRKSLSERVDGYLDRELGPKHISRLFRDLLRHPEIFGRLARDQAWIDELRRSGIDHPNLTRRVMLRLGFDTQTIERVQRNQLAYRTRRWAAAAVMLLAVTAAMWFEASTRDLIPPRIINAKQVSPLNVMAGALADDVEPGRAAFDRVIDVVDQVTEFVQFDAAFSEMLFASEEGVSTEADRNASSGLPAENSSESTAESPWAGENPPGKGQSDTRTPTRKQQDSKHAAPPLDAPKIAPANGDGVENGKDPDDLR